MTESLTTTATAVTKSAPEAEPWKQSAPATKYKENSSLARDAANPASAAPAAQIFAHGC
jgi:hypothetical protein